MRHAVRVQSENAANSLQTTRPQSAHPSVSRIHSDHLAQLSAAIGSSERLQDQLALARQMQSSGASPAQRSPAPPTQMRSILIADDQGLEHEADVMGARSMQAPEITQQSETPVETLSRADASADAPLQAVWIKDPEEEEDDRRRLVWEPNEGGLRWYYDPRSGLMSFRILPDAPAYGPALEQYAGRQMPYQDWLDAWIEHGWKEPVLRIQAPAEEIFGTNFPKNVTEGEQVLETEKPYGEKLAVLEGALRAGYRTFDVAETYDSTEILFRAAHNVGVHESELRLIYKIKPEGELATEGSAVSAVTSNAPVTHEESARNRARAQIEGFRPRLQRAIAGIPGSTERVLMLHDIPANPERANAYLQQLYEEAVAGSGRVISLGVSNVDIHNLPPMCEFAAQHLMRIRFVQNQFTPYDQDTPVRSYCAARGISYQGFGIFGGAGLGACAQGFGLPQRQLQVLQDPRFLTLAAEEDQPAASLLLAWAAHKGVTLILYSGSHASANLQALRLRLSYELLARIDALFVHPGEVGASAESSRPVPSAAIDRQSPIARLYAAVPEPIAWHILDTLMGNPLVRAMFERVAGNTLEHTTQAEPLKNIVLRIMRLVTHLQVLSQSQQRAFSGRRWTDLLLELFSSVAGEIGSSGDIGKLYAWTQKEYAEIGGALHAPGHLLEVAVPEAELAVPVAEMTERRAYELLMEIQAQLEPDPGEYDPEELWSLALRCSNPPQADQKQTFLRLMSSAGYIIVSEERALHVFAAYVSAAEQRGVAPVDGRYDAELVWAFAKSAVGPSQKPRFLEILRAKKLIN